MRQWKSVLAMVVMMMGAAAFAQDAEAPARMETKVIQLQGAGLSSAYLQAIQDIVRQDYSREANFQYDQRDRTLVITATPITIEKVERFLNKVDVPRERLVFVVWVLRTDGDRFDHTLDAAIVKELKEIDIKGARVVNRARLETIAGRQVEFSIAPDSGTGYNIAFRPDGRRESLLLSEFRDFLAIRSLIKSILLEKFSIQPVLPGGVTLLNSTTNPL